MIKAIFIDIDGTLRDSNRNLSTKTIETVKKVSEKGILVILCSGRPRKYTEEISRECFASKYIITSSGGDIYDYEQNKILYVNKMDKEALIKLYEIANPEDVRFIMNIGEGRVVNKVKHAEQEKKLEENIKDFVDKNDVPKVFFNSNSSLFLQKLDTRNNGFCILINLSYNSLKLLSHKLMIIFHIMFRHLFKWHNYFIVTHF